MLKYTFTTTDDRVKVEKDLNNASGFFRSLLAERLQIRHTPELKFIFDESIEYGQKIEEIIKELHKED
ncbi:MAG: 30S ribosome-binding factor RbfA [Clostridium sp.]|nr:MAG: 30S ribosome-binding factor RbfA [Clostridium sp.]